MPRSYVRRFRRPADVPPLIWGVFMGGSMPRFCAGTAYRDIAVSVATVICWLSLYLFERLWAKTIGLSLTLLILR